MPMNTPLTANNRKSKIVYLPQSKQVPLKKRLFFFLLILIFIYFVVLFARQYWRMYKMQQSLAAITERIEEVKQENEELQAEIERLHSSDYIEQIARELAWYAAVKYFSIFGTGTTFRRKSDGPVWPAIILDKRDNPYIIRIDILARRNIFRMSLEVGAIVEGWSPV